MACEGRKWEVGSQRPAAEGMKGTHPVSEQQEREREVRLCRGLDFIHLLEVLRREVP